MTEQRFFGHYWTIQISVLYRDGGTGRGLERGVCRPLDICRSVNPISTRGGRLCPSTLPLAPQIFSSTAIPATGVSSLRMPGVPWHPQILAHQLTLFQLGGKIMPTYLPLTHQIFSSAAIPAILTQPTYVPSKRAFMCTRDKGTPHRATVH